MPTALFTDVLPFEGLTVLVTGVIPSMSRTGAQNAIADLGGKAAASVTGKVDLVVLGDGAGLAKSQKARDLGIAVLPGATFAALAADPSTWDGQRPGMTFDDYESLSDDEPEEVDPEADVPLADRHLVSQAVLAVRGPDGRYVTQVRRSCRCGHRWLAESIDGYRDGCPVAAGTAILCTTKPWAA